MRILMLGAKEYPFGVSARYDKKAGGGIEVHVEKLSKYLAKEGHDVFIITRRFPGQKSEEHIGKIHIYRVSFLYNRYLRTLSFNFLSLFKALLILKKYKIHIIHSHGMVASFFASLLSMITRTPMVMTPHGTIDEWGIFKIPLKLFEILSLKTARKVIFISRFAMKRLTLRRRFSYTLLSNAIDPEDFQRTQKRKHGSVIFGFIGRLEKVKGITPLVNAFKRLPEDKCELYIAGEGTLRQEILKTAETSKNIKFLGWMKPGEFFSLIDVFVLPSEEKGQPLSLLEAMASGKIIITSLGFIKDGITGILTKPDEKDVYRKMLYVLKNFRKLKQLGENARKESKRFTWKREVKRFINEYRSVLKQSQSSKICTFI